MIIIMRFIRIIFMPMIMNTPLLTRMLMHMVTPILVPPIMRMLIFMFMPMPTIVIIPILCLSCV